MLKPFELRNSMGDLHPLTTVWRFLQPLLFGQIHTNKQAISAHYDIDPTFFLSFLDPEMPCYTQGVYTDNSETLSAATRRKFDYVFARCRLEPGHHILEVGPGWGAWFEYAWRRGVKCTGLTISQTSADYLNKRSRELGADWEILICDLLAYRTERKYDAVVIMGVMEHLPQYKPVLDRVMSMLKPGGRIILQTTLTDHLGTRIVRALTSRRELAQRGYRISWFSQRDISDACHNAGLQIFEMRRHGLGIPFGDRLWPWANFQLERRLQKWASRHGADAIYLLGAG